MKILIVSNDAAGAEILSSWVRLKPQNSYSYVLGLPAEKIFKKKIDSVINLSPDNLENLVQDFDFVLTGTSQSSDLEKKAIFWSKKFKVNVATILDYWVNFYSRFNLNNKLIYPDEIWVTDKYALKNAKKELPGSKILLKNNPYIEELLLNKKPRPNSREVLKILYVCQPYNEDGLSDIEAVDYFMSLLANQSSKKIEVLLRLHPLENKEKYDGVVEKFKESFLIKVVFNSQLSDDLNWSDFVVGMHAQALAVAVEFGIESFHCIPDNGKASVLPHHEIKDFRKCTKIFENKFIF